MLWCKVRCERRSESTRQPIEGFPSSSSATISPSMAVSLGSFAKAFAMEGYRRLKSLSLRDRRAIVLAVFHTIAR